MSGTMRGSCPRFVPVCGVAMLAAIGLGNFAQAQGAKMRATVDTPATVPVSRAASSIRGSERLIVTVDGYEPSPAGPVTFVVTARCGDATHELGRFGILESGPTAPGGAIEPQSFGFNIPDDPSCHDPRDVIIRIEPTLGDGAGASISIRGARIE